MSWLYNKISTVFNATLAAIGGLFASQIETFASQYLQRLGGHLEEATSNLERIITSVLYQNMEESVRRVLELESLDRVDHLQRAYNMINESNFFTKPFKLIFYSEEKIFLGTINNYVPAFNFTIETIIYIIISIVITIVLLELIKNGILMLASHRRRRKFKSFAKIS
mgnify:CR=1 FL=1